MEFHPSITKNDNLKLYFCVLKTIYLQPDITAPGVNILAAFPASGISPDALVYGMDSGTSMACPHVSGVAAVIKAQNKDWSPAEIMSAIMTTGYHSNS